MIEIKIPKEITEYKEKFLFGLTIRQCISLVVALVICVPLYIFGKDYLGDDLTGWLVILIAVPILGFGFFRYDGMAFEKFVGLIYRQKCVEPQIRTYEELPIFWDCREEIISDELAHQIAEQAHKKRRERKKK